MRTWPTPRWSSSRNLYRSDQRGAPYAYASAVAVEEKSVIDYNRGNPDGVLDPGEVPRPPDWSGFRICPLTFEFWKDRPFRLHERLLFTRSRPDASWTILRLYP